MELRSACLLAIGVGIARFAFTPILPLMTSQASMTSTMATACATANYLGYLVGALVGLRLTAPRRAGGVWVPRVAAVMACASLAAMPVGEPAAWLALRFLAGVFGAVLFIVAADDLLSGGWVQAAGWGFGGVGAGVVISAIVVSTLGASWRWSWWAVAAAAAILTALAWHMADPRPERSPRIGQPGAGATRRYPFAVVWWIYTLEGTGYIVAGTFLVAAVSAQAPGAIGSHAWIAVGLFAIPSCTGWTWLASRTEPAAVLCIALLVQATGVVLATFDSPTTAMMSGILFGATIIGVPWLAVGLARSSGRRRDVALMTVGYGVGQALGPIVARPLQENGYQLSLIASACVLGLAAVLAAGLAVPRVSTDVPR